MSWFQIFGMNGVAACQVGLECISCIHSSNGLAILAHPRKLPLDDVQLKTLMIQLKNAGLDGI